MVNNENKAIEALLNYYNSGNLPSLGQFSTYYFSYIYRTAFYYVNNRDDAEDICQQVFINLMNKNCRCDGAYEKIPIKVRTWLGSICANTSKNFLRQKKNMNNRIQKSSELKSREVVQEDNYSDLLSELLNFLPVKYRAPILLRYKEDLSFAEISDILGTKPVTIRSHINRGLKQLRLRFEQQKVTITMIGLLKLISSLQVEAASPAILQKCLAKQFQNKSARFASHSETIKIFTPVKALATFAITLIIAYGAIQYFKKPKADLPVAKAPAINQKINIPINDVQIYKTWDFSKVDGSDLNIVNGDFKHNKKKGQFEIIGKAKGAIVFPLKYQNPLQIQVKCTFNSRKNIDAVSLYVYPAKNPKNVDGQIVYIDDLELNQSDLKNKSEFAIFTLKTFIILFKKNYQGLAISQINEPMKGNNFVTNIQNLNINHISFQKINHSELNTVFEMVKSKKMKNKLKSKILAEISDVLAKADGNLKEPEGVTHANKVKTKNPQ